MRPIPMHFSRCGANLEAARVRWQLGQTHSYCFLTDRGWPNMSRPGLLTISTQRHFHCYVYITNHLLIIIHLWTTAKMWPSPKNIRMNDSMRKNAEQNTKSMQHTHSSLVNFRFRQNWEKQTATEYYCTSAMTDPQETTFLFQCLPIALQWLQPNRKTCSQFLSWHHHQSRHVLLLFCSIF